MHSVTFPKSRRVKSQLNIEDKMKTNHQYYERSKRMDGRASSRPAGKITGTSCDIFYIDYSSSEIEHSSVSFHSFPAKAIISLRLYLNLYLYSCPEVDLS